jgi:lysophospholipase L1-like esterase
MLERFERDVLPFQPRYLLILGGTNSLRGGTPAAQVIADLIAIREKCLRYDIRPIFLTLPPINPIAIENVFQEPTVPNWRTEFDLVNAFIRQQRYHIDLEPHFLDDNRELPARFAVDGLHIDIEGKRLMGNVINHFWKTVAD